MTAFQSQDSVSGQFRETAEDLLFLPSDLGHAEASARLTRATGVKTFLFSLDDFPHARPVAAPGAPPAAFTEAEIVSRMDWLVAQGEGFIRRPPRDLLPTAALVTKAEARQLRRISGKDLKLKQLSAHNYGLWHAVGGLFAVYPLIMQAGRPRRLGLSAAKAGPMTMHAVAIVAPDRRNDPWAAWSPFVSGFAPYLSGLPSAAAFRHFVVLHEVQHMCQPHGNNGWQAAWEREYDSDSGAFARMERRAARLDRLGAAHAAEAADLRAGIACVTALRALGILQGENPAYWTSLALDAAASGQRPPSALDCVMAAYELQQRIIVRSWGSSYDKTRLFPTLRRVRGNLNARARERRYWGEKNLAGGGWVVNRLGPVEALQYLKIVAEQDKALPPLVRRQADLILEAAARYLPSLSASLADVPKPGRPNRLGPLEPPASQPPARRRII